MKNSGRRQVKTPVGNKTKRGAELEGTPKTPRSFEVTPCKSNIVDTFSQEPEDRRLHSRSRRPLQWNNLAKGITAMAAESTTEDLLENTSSPFLHPDLKSTGESEAVAALSPICVNAIRGGNSDQQGGQIKAAMKKLSKMPPSQEFAKIRDCDTYSKRRGHGRALGSCPSSPECQISLFTGEPIFLWSNAAFNHWPAHVETVCLSKDITSSTNCSSSGSTARHKAAITERPDCEAESKVTDQDPLPKTVGGQHCIANGCQRESPIVEHEIGSTEFLEPEDSETKPHVSRGECAELSESSSARKLVFENDKSCSGGLVLEPDQGAFPYPVQPRSETIEHTDLQKSVMQAGQAAKREEERVEIGLEEIEKEIQHLRERLTELYLQKRKREKEMGRLGEQSTKKAETASHVGNKEAADQQKERSVVSAMLQHQHDKRSVVTGAKCGRRAVSISSSSASVLQSPRAQSMRSYHEVASRLKEETPASRRACCPPAGSASKLLELRRSVSAASQRMESNRSSDTQSDRSKVLRRLSMSGSMISTPSNGQGQQQQQRSSSSKGNCTPSRVVASRYGRAVTPDACRPSGGSTIACKKRDQRSSAPSSPLPQPPASVVSSPLKKVTTLRSGYPSRSGLATPTTERQQRLKSLSNTAAATPSPTSYVRAQDLGCLTSKSPLARVDSPKSTAALYKCLESLLEDSKHFFKRLSPARSHPTHTLPQQLESMGDDASANALSAHLATVPCKPLEHTLPSINTCRMDAISPRDSGCVKRVCDRQKRHFFFATQESQPSLESALALGHQNFV